MAVAEEAEDRDDYDTADRAVKAGLAAGFAASSPTLEAAIRGRAKEVEDLHAAYTETVQKAAQTLIEKPDDPDAEPDVGQIPVPGERGLEPRPADAVPGKRPGFEGAGPFRSGVGVPDRMALA